jgi:hypothetical protein
MQISIHDDANTMFKIHARLGELLLMAAKSSQGNDASRQLSEALKRFCRSIELCDDYLRGFYGLKLVSVQTDFRLCNMAAYGILDDEAALAGASEGIKAVR